MLLVRADHAEVFGDDPHLFTLELRISGGIVIHATLNRMQAAVLMATTQDRLKSTADHSREHFAAEITRIAAPGPDL